MSDNSTILSLCIPTYNRASVLDEALGKIVSYDSFDETVEIVISDNCSNDNTQEVGMRYASQYSNIKYYRNQENILDRNFVKVLDLGVGRYLKLQNDWCLPTEDGLAKMKQFLMANIDAKKPVFFTSGWARSKNTEIIDCSNLDEYIGEMSIMVTFNNVFGTWRTDWEKLKNKERYSKLKLLQVDWTYSLVGNRGALLYNSQTQLFLDSMLRSVRSGYNYFEVMLDNYYTIMEQYVEQGLVSQSALARDKKCFLKRFRPELFQALICRTASLWQYDTTGTWNRMFKHYKKKAYFYVFVITLPFQWFFHASVRNFGR